MTPDPSQVLPASAVGRKGEWTCRVAAADLVLGLAAGASSTNEKQWACEDSLAALGLEGGAWLLVVADAHWGGSSSVAIVEGLAAAWSRTRPGPALSRLRATLVRLEMHVTATAAADDPSETTALVAHVDPVARRLAWINVGDSLLLAVAPDGGVRALNEQQPSFVGRAPLAVQPRPDEGEVDLAPGDLVLLATDGLEERASDLDLPAVGRRLRAPGTLQARVEDLLRHQSASGRDNLGVVAMALT